MPTLRGDDPTTTKDTPMITTADTMSAVTKFGNTRTKARVMRTAAKVSTITRINVRAV
jgi:hypothetical protein